MRDALMILFGILGMTLLVVGILGMTCAAEASPRCCDYDAQGVRDRLTIAWSRAFAGEPLGDQDLQAFSDADSILKCVAGK